MLSMGPLDMSLFPPAHCCGRPGRLDSRGLEQVVFHQRRSEWWNGKRVNKTSVHVVSVSLCFKVSDNTFSALSLFFCFHFFFAILVPSYCVIAEAVILGHVSPGSAGSEHWTKSSSGGPPESRPSWPTHCKEDEITNSLEPLVLLLMKWTHFVSSKLCLAAPDADVEDWVQADISRSRKVLFILAHLDGVKPLVHWVHTELGGRRLFPAGMQSTFTFYSQCFYWCFVFEKDNQS